MFRDETTLILDFSVVRSEEHTSELQSRGHLVCRLLLEKKKKQLRERTILVNCDLIQADVCTRTASITGAFFTLVFALEKRVDAGTFRSVSRAVFDVAVS